MRSRPKSQATAVFVLGLAALGPGAPPAPAMTRADKALARAFLRQHQRGYAVTSVRHAKRTPYVAVLYVRGGTGGTFAAVGEAFYRSGRHVRPNRGALARLGGHPRYVVSFSGSATYTKKHSDSSLAESDTQTFDVHWTGAYGSRAHPVVLGSHGEVQPGPFSPSGSMTYTGSSASGTTNYDGSCSSSVSASGGPLDFAVDSRRRAKLMLSIQDVQSDSSSGDQCTGAGAGYPGEPSSLFPLEFSHSVAPAHEGPDLVWRPFSGSPSVHHHAVTTYGSHTIDEDLSGTGSADFELVGIGR